MSDPTSQPPLPGRPPAWNRDNEPTLPDGVPNQQPPYYEQTQPPYYERTQPPRYYGQPPTQPQYAGYYVPPQPKSRTGWLLAGAIAVVVALIGGVGAIVLTHSGGGDSAQPIPTYSDSLSSSEASAGPSTEPSADPTDTPSTVPVPETPAPTPTPTERRRTLKDVDQGLLVYDDVYIKPATGWRKFHAAKYTMSLSPREKGAIVLVVVNPVGYRAAGAVPIIVRDVVALDRLTGVKKGAVKTLRPANSNIGSQAQMAFTGRMVQNGATISVTARCTTMTGVESIHNVTVSVCVESRKDTADAAFADAARMLASVARSI